MEESKKTIFISHSTEDSAIAKEMIGLLEHLGVPTDQIFCSSVEGQGVRSGKRFPDIIAQRLNNSSLIIYLITKSFLDSPYCTQEIGYSWTSKKENFIILKSDTVNNEDITGFIDGTYKYLRLSKDGVGETCDTVIKMLGLGRLEYSTLNRYIDDFMKHIQLPIAEEIEREQKTVKQIEEERLKALEKQFDTLSIGEKQVIALLYFSNDRTKYFPHSSAVINLLCGKRIAVRVTSESAGFGFQFGYSLENWAVNFIFENPSLQKELKALLKQPKSFNDPPEM